MHVIQEKLLKLIDEKNIGALTLRAIGKLVGNEQQPQKIKHHLSELEKKGFILVDRKNEKISRVNARPHSKDLFFSIPVLGSANCGPATLYADENIEGYLKISKKIVPWQKGIFALKAQGYSLNRAMINGKNIEPGDFVIIDSQQTAPRDGEYVLFVIDQMANIKKFRLDRANQRIVLLSESSQPAHPIFIHQDDDFRINGKVIDVIKKFEEG
ncbi:MAG TPA: S24 family peptidase [Flavitalea sp.]|nr:S24 family peptidase [Flavitalea sp.]HTF30615.1 S24 family peptidase [Flavitalea sp.]